MYWGCLPFLVLFISIIITYQKRSFILAFILLSKMHGHVNWEFLFHVLEELLLVKMEEMYFDLQLQN